MVTSGMDIKELFNCLESIRVASHMSLSDMAKKLGYSENYLYRLRSGNRAGNSAGFLGAVLNAYPGLEKEVIRYLREFNNG
jgi:transcriptional regulator with XRE-family HTH domain